VALVGFGTPVRRPWEVGEAVEAWTVATASLAADQREALVRVAPDLDPATIGEDDHLQEDLELDSMDFLNLVSALHVRLGVAVPEADYPRLATVRMASG
jgi:acyl carrier protein